MSCTRPWNGLGEASLHLRSAQDVEGNDFRIVSPCIVPIARFFQRHTMGVVHYPLPQTIAPDQTRSTYSRATM